ncbi:E3 ubiquitin-protein ligase RNF19B-like isoform X2 [Cimex lectularius]|nr:E3 ubiquitin-protein ligase RNF19B-like isoform X2 [Cimex lectularius]XP_014262672.1 E3 ubiquitin-protein ligase RNF19B-like isoform X2 [Cimex lectularius]XP_014262673.1 E3 ubiquitin-protein ligase RNF19B-like isoform X2 [Cimex lectularius]
MRKASSSRTGVNDEEKGSNVGGSARKRGFSRFSLRRFLHPSPLLVRRFLSLNRPQQQSCTQPLQTTPNYASGETPIDSKNNPEQKNEETAGRTSVSSDPTKSDGLIECNLCLSELAPEYFPHLITCPHRFCYDCFQTYLRMEISESRVSVSCPQCSEPMHPNDIRMILNDKSRYEKYEDFMVRKVLAVDPDTRWCPAPDCSYAVIASGCASCPKIKCERPGCGSYFCYHCKAAWHPNQTCDAARAQRSPNVRSSSLSFSQDSQHRDDIKPCPRCQVLIVKMDDGSCNHMTCAVCGAEFCWLCMKEISDLHYLSPSGCTFWGKKPWSRKKKILWQLGTLVGAPVGIGLVAGIAVPAIIIGIPVWVGRKLYTRYEHSNKHKRNFAIAGGVSASVLISPILASLAVGIGVPILLFYVYGVVPVSLCRSGGCGVSTSATGVRFDFDDEGDMMGALATKSSDGDSHPGGNPSIGEVSLSLGSGSQLEREADRESASFVALAGSIASNSNTGQRLEILADVVVPQRFSLSSETASATASLSDKSAVDDGGASTKGLAGSVLNFKMDGGSLSNCRVASNDSTSIVEPVSLIPPETIPQWSEPHALSSLEELTTCMMRKLMKKKKLLYKEDTDDISSERVRFDSHVSFINSDLSQKHTFYGGTASPGGNSSIGEVSLSVGSGSQFETETDFKSSNLVALPDCKSNITGQRLEILADVLATQRLSLTNDTVPAATNLLDKSIVDDCGARALTDDCMLNVQDEAVYLSDTVSQLMSSQEDAVTSRKGGRRHKSSTDLEEGPSGEKVRFDKNISYIDPEVNTQSRHSKKHIEDIPPSTSKTISSLRSMFFQSGNINIESPRSLEAPILSLLPSETFSISMPE